MRLTILGILALISSVVWFTSSAPSGENSADLSVAKEFTDDEFERHVVELKSKLPRDSNFQVIVQKPFVVIGNQDPSAVKQWATGTVKWSVDRLKQLYEFQDPDHIINIWLLKDKESYERQCREVVGYAPHTPFGFYSSTRRALMMNISTGGGTLVHEIVHPFIERNFPDCPAWFNEGLASLYEQCGDQDGQIRGRTNWRLRGLHAAITDESLPSTRALTATTTNEFYRAEGGDNYAQARYLCYFLQEKGLLHKYYHAFRRRVGDDPTGYQTLQEILGHPDMEKFDASWRKYCLGLRFP